MKEKGLFFFSVTLLVLLGISAARADGYTSMEPETFEVSSEDAVGRKFTVRHRGESTPVTFTVTNTGDQTVSPPSRLVFRHFRAAGSIKLEGTDGHTGDHDPFVTLDTPLAPGKTTDPITTTVQWDREPRGWWHRLLRQYWGTWISFKLELQRRADQDGDGVLDRKDRCEGTPEGESVDRWGCSASQRDADGDGVPDKDDLCPRTASGESVNDQGCPKGEFVAYGQQVFSPQDNGPRVFERQFTIKNPDTEYTLHVDKGREKGRPALKEIWLNGRRIKVNGHHFGRRGHRQRDKDDNRHDWKHDKHNGANDHDWRDRRHGKHNRDNDDGGDRRDGRVAIPVELLNENRLRVELHRNADHPVTIWITGVDNDRPTIDAVLSNPANEAGWHNGDVTVSFECRDATSPVAECTEPQLVNEEGGNQAITGTVRDSAGHEATVSVTVNLDKTAPTVSADLSPAANAAGWHNSDVQVAFSCADALSGVIDCPAGMQVTEEGNHQSAPTVHDAAGNEATVEWTVNIDKTAPAIVATPSAPANAQGWHNADVLVGFECSDGLSGIADCTAPVQVGDEGRDQVIAGTARDRAGNQAGAQQVINLDKTPPTVSVTRQPAANDAGWHNSDVTLDYECNDALSGVVNCPGAQTVTTEGADQAITQQVSDAAGNPATVETLVNLDKTAPQITISQPADGADVETETVTVMGTVTDQLALPEQIDCPDSSAPVASEGGFECQVALVPGDNTLSFSTEDPAGNAASVEWLIHFNDDSDGDGVPDSDDQCPGTPSDEAANDAGCAPSQLDSDNDGVTDDIDLCPGTLNAFPVNENGCSANQLDADDDGVSDADDDCPDTPATETANADGCSPSQLDTDLDGVSNADDQCPGTEPDSVVDSAGCAAYQRDTDGDTVSDDVDQCPGTPAGETADANGCSPSQRDSDNDGVADADDQCPGTPAGEAVNADGCGLSQLDSDDDGISDADDQCPGTPAGDVANADGCAFSQLDTDNDGISDADDSCSGTPAGESADADGCAPSQLDGDSDGVSDAEDDCPATPQGTSIDAGGCGELERDTDGDGIPDVSDAFPEDPERSELPVITIDTPDTLTTVGSTPIEVNGEVDPEAVSVTVNGVEVDPGGGRYSASVALEEGHNTINARMVGADGVTATASVSVSLDLTPPRITLESHEDGQTVHTDRVAISGLINDIVRGTVEEHQATVTVNGIGAAISNRSYLAENIPLTPGTNLISVMASDQAGNTNSILFSLDYRPPAGRKLEIAGGQSQSARIATELAEPLSVRVIGDDGQPVPDKPVVFRVIQGAGLVGAGTGLEGRGYIATTDAEGMARTRFKLGNRVGVGSHKVRARVVGYEDEAVFYATATGGIADKLSVNSGNNQRGGVFQPLPAPFVVVATDEGNNVVEGARVEFRVKQGGGQLENGERTITAVTDSDGRASAHLTLGGKQGLDQQRVVATLLDGPDGRTITSIFSASGFAVGPASETSISGLVVDNQDNPVPGVTVRVEGANRQAVVDDNGQFTIDNVPVGPVHLIADGSTAAVEGEWPSLGYDIVTVSGVDNPLPAPIYMVKLNTDNAVYAGPEDVELTLDEVPGFKLEIPAGSVTFPDGSTEGLVSVTPVNASKVPMAPPNGMQPQFIVTIQPTGAKFDPPARLSLPNVDAHPPGAQVEMFSYDHDLEAFVAIGLGTVSEDATVIRSNPGVGVVKAGWHCGAQPGGDGCCSGPDECDDYCAKPDDGCDAGCSIDKDKPLPGDQQTDGDCQTATCGGSEDNDGDVPDNDQPGDCQKPACDSGTPISEDDNGDVPKDKEGDCKKPICKDGAPDSENADDPPECQKCNNGNSEPDPNKNGNTCEGDCGICKEGTCEIDEDKPLKEEKQDPNDCKVLLCGGGYNPADEIPEPGNVCKICKGGSVENAPEETTCDDGDVCTVDDKCTGGECSGTEWEDFDPDDPPPEVPPDYERTDYDNAEGILDEGVERDIFSDFGWRNLVGESDFHGGTDIGTIGGEDINASTNTSESATVQCAGACNLQPGDAVIIDNGDGTCEAYAHMQSVNVEAGDTVEAGDQIGEGGGQDVAGHLHWATFDSCSTMNDSTATNNKPSVNQDPCE